MLKSTTSDLELFRMMDRTDSPQTTNDSRQYTSYDFVKMMNDPNKKREYERAKYEWLNTPTTIKRIYGESNQWSSFVPTVFLDGILEDTSYRAISDTIASQVDVPQGLEFFYRSFEDFGRAQHVSEGGELTRRKGLRRRQSVPIHTIGVRSSVTMEEQLDLPFSVMELESRTIASSISLERDLLWIDSLNDATTGQNAIDFNNSLTASDMDLETLLAVINWFFSPFDKSLDNITLSNPFDDSGTTSAAGVEGLMRLGKFRVTDIVMPANRYFDIINNTVLQSQNIWTNSTILDTGALSVPLLGANIWRANIGSFSNADDPGSFTTSDELYFIDRNQLGGGTIGVRQPLTVMDWPSPEVRSTDFQIFTRLGFAVQNRRAIVRVAFSS